MTDRGGRTSLGVTPADRLAVEHAGRDPGT